MLVPPLEIGAPAMDLATEKEKRPPAIIIDVSAPLSSFHYQVKNVGVVVSWIYEVVLIVIV